MAAGQSSTRPITLVLLGELCTGKSASGNTILGQEVFQSEITADALTIQCQKVERDVCGTRVTVIDTPDFFDEDLVEPDRHVRECREMCEGEVCVYLLVTRLRRFTEGERDILKRLEKKLGMIRDRTIILFTYGDNLSQSIDDYVRNTNTHLQKLIRECGNRYNVFNNKDREEWRGQVERLMGQIRRLNVEENKRGEEGKRGVKRGGGVPGNLQDRPRLTQPGQSSTHPITLVLLGKVGSGKSASGNTILGADKFASGATADPLTTQCQEEDGYVCGRRVTVIDTPDFFHVDLQKRDKQCKDMCKGRECVYLLVIQIGRFTEGEKDILEKLDKKLGRIRDRTIILFTRGDDLKGQSIDDYVKNTNRHLRSLIEECSVRYHVFNNKINDEEQVKQLMEMVIRVPQQPKGSQGSGHWWFFG